MLERYEVPFPGRTGSKIGGRVLHNLSKAGVYSIEMVSILKAVNMKFHKRIVLPEKFTQTSPPGGTAQTPIR